MKLKLFIFAFVLFQLPVICCAQAEKTKKPIHPFLAYELGEAMFNQFNSLSGEVGLAFSNNHLLRLVHQNVTMTEEHLSSGFAVTVQGNNVKGKLFGFEAFYSLPIKKWKDSKDIFYLSPSIGYYENEYTHTLLDQSFSHSSATAGIELSFRQTNLFKVKGLYYTLAIPIRVHFSPHGDIKLGDTKIQNNQIDNNIWFMIGFQF